ncbi:unnamed protein product, partial [Amoebophrya sp. A25]
ENEHQEDHLEAFFDDHGDCERTRLGACCYQGGAAQGATPVSCTYEGEGPSWVLRMKLQANEARRQLLWYWILTQTETQIFELLAVNRTT